MVRGTPRSEKLAASREVIVIGGGPSGLCLAAALAERGRETCVVAPDLGGRWEASYGAFLREVAGTGIESAIGRVYERPHVWVSSDHRIDVKERYARFDTSQLQQLLIERCARAGVEFVSGRVSDVRAEGASGFRLKASVEPGPGDGFRESRSVRLSARLVIDASGSGRFSSTRESTRPLVQSAFGYLAEVEAHPFLSGEMSLMDFRPLESREEGPASFLYAMPETGEPGGPGTVFFQETVLVGAQATSMDALRCRLTHRLRQMGIELSRVLGTERCFIPMGGSLPEPSSNVLAFGAAAGFVHPASGYQLAHMVRLAPEVADVVASCWQREPREVIHEAVNCMWPSDRRRAWRLFELGAHALTTLTPEQLREFVGEFFELPGRRGVRFMTGTMEPEEILEAMWCVFSRVSRRVRTDLFRGSAVAAARLLTGSASGAG